MNPASFNYLCRFCLMSPIVPAVMSVVLHDNMLGFSNCVGRQEILMFNLENFWEETLYKRGRLTNNPWYHPQQLIISCFCKSSFIDQTSYFSTFYQQKLSDHSLSKGPKISYVYNCMCKFF